jgi:hypothetical protein
MKMLNLVACLELLDSSFVLERRSYWIPRSYTLALSEKHNAFLRLLKNKSFTEKSMSKARLYATGHPRPWNLTRTSLAYTLLGYMQKTPTSHARSSRDHKMHEGFPRPFSHPGHAIAQ